MFELNSARQLVVRTESLDRDSPNQPVLTLQVIIMEKQGQEMADFYARENSNGVVMSWSEIRTLDNVQRPTAHSMSQFLQAVPAFHLVHYPVI